MKDYELEYSKYQDLARQAVAEGCVLLKNDGETLPINSGDKVAVFGRNGFNYYSSGLGSGGLVNTKYVVSILDALQKDKTIEIDEKLLRVYKNWIKDNPFDIGEGWGKVPWSQKEMLISDEIVEASSHCDIALVIIGRTAGEDQDSESEPGSYLLSQEEEILIEKVSKNFNRTAIVLNVGNIIDMNWVNKYNPSAVLYVWHGGQEGGNGVADVLMGKVNPSGKLTSTIAKSIDDYPSTKNFGDKLINIYQEDIYVGYRYFETFNQSSVLYPFGYGLSYTSFNYKAHLKAQNETGLSVTLETINEGLYDGKAVIEVYMKPPQGKLGKPSRVLVGYHKTHSLKAKDSIINTIDIPWSYMASYDDSGVSGYENAFIIEEGDYEFFVGGDVRSAETMFYITIDKTFLVEQLSESLRPVKNFERMKPTMNNEDNLHLVYESVPTRSIETSSKLEENLPITRAYTGDKNIKLVDVFDGKSTLDSFVDQLSDDDLIHLFRGEGMCSPKSTPGVASAFGGLTDNLKSFGIPVACCSDGPSGIRMDCGTEAFSLPNGTSLGSTFNNQLVEELYGLVGMELRKNRIDTLLGPGMNIQRNPLNGRNFEYISEDSLLTGKISAAQILGMASSGSTGTIKHFCGNNQESGRSTSDSVISERALREIYLKGFEIAIKEGGARSVMTTYGGVNGLWTAGSYDLNTDILRNQWGFDGIVMTDWWAKANNEGEEPSNTNRSPMVAAGNDLYMVTVDALTNPDNDNVGEALSKGSITRGQLHRNALNILNFILKSTSMLHFLDRIDQKELDAMMDVIDEDQRSEAEFNLVFVHGQQKIQVIDEAFIGNNGDSKYINIDIQETGHYKIEFDIVSTHNTLAQLPISIFVEHIFKETISFNGADGNSIKVSGELGEFHPKEYLIKLYFGNDGIDIRNIYICKD